MSLTRLIQEAHKAWHGVKVGEPDWGEDSHSIAFTAELKEGLVVHFIMNAYWEALDFELPPSDGHPWRRWIDTSLASPEDIVEWQTAAPTTDRCYRAGPRSVVVLYAAGG